MIELANESELNLITELAKKTREHMIANGLHQWVGNYPNYDIFLADYKNNALFVYREGNQILASISLLPENDAAYKEITWLRNNSLVIHRVLVDPNQQGKGLGKKLFEFAKSVALNQGYKSIKVDTHPDNYKMQSLILKSGYIKIGYLSGINRLAYEFVLC